MRCGAGGRGRQRRVGGVTMDTTPHRLGPWTACAEDCVERAIAGLRAVLDGRGDRRVLLLCDSTLADPLADDIAAAGLARREVDLISQGASTPPLYLAEVPDEIRHERLVNASIRLAVDEAMRPAPAGKRPRSMSAWLATDLPLAEVAQRLVLRARLRDAQGRVRIPVSYTHLTLPTKA